MIDSLSYEYSKGKTLFEIHKTLKKWYIRSEAHAIFYAFIKANKNNKNFMAEFNKTAFEL